MRNVQVPESCNTTNTISAFAIEFLPIDRTQANTRLIIPIIRLAVQNFAHLEPTGLRANLRERVRVNNNIESTSVLISWSTFTEVSG